MIVLLRLSETTITTQNKWHLESNLGDSSYGRFSKPLLFRSASVFETRYRTVSAWELVYHKHAINLHGSHLLSPKGGCMSSSCMDLS